jgi:hypothetical protein
MTILPEITVLVSADQTIQRASPVDENGARGHNARCGDVVMLLNWLRPHKRNVIDVRAT